LAIYFDSNFVGHHQTMSQPPSSASTPPPPPTAAAAAAGGDETTASTTTTATTGVTRTTLDSSVEKPQPRTQLEDFTRCADCHLWKLMMSFYDRKGIDSWSQGVVPHFITCNAFIGRSYAKVSA
jgi:hypothetical protein